MLVELNNIEGLANAIVHLKNDIKTRKEISESARLSIINKYSIEKSVAMLIDVYQSLLNTEKHCHDN